MSSKNIDTRTKILKTTWRLLETGRASEVRMSDIAKSVGISRQAVYLHFPTRAELLIAVTRYIDQEKNIEQRLAASRAATSGRERLDAFINAWGNYIPEVYGVAKALMIMKHDDEAASEAWNDRMQALRAGCKAAIEALQKEAMLKRDLKPQAATDLLWTLLSIPNWEQLTKECNWSQAQYLSVIKTTAIQSLIQSKKSKV